MKVFSPCFRRYVDCLILRLFIFFYYSFFLLLLFFGSSFVLLNELNQMKGALLKSHKEYRKGKGKKAYEGVVHYSTITQKTTSQ